MKISLGFSPCPNDTYIFDALVNHKIDTKGLEFEVFLADVEELNQLALNNQLMVTKMSYHAYAYCSKNYNVLTSGSALGNHCGPLLISKRPFSQAEIEDALVAIPGELTTAHFLLNYYRPNLKHKQTALFSEIESLVLNEDVDLGVIIHENRFTYMDKGLQLVEDLGAYWEDQTNYPIPLGGIMVRNDLELNLQQEINQMIQNSIVFANKNKGSLPEFVTTHAQEMSEQVMRQHIDLYVNDFSLDLGQTGRDTINYMMNFINPEITVQFVSHEK